MKRSRIQGTSLMIIDHFFRILKIKFGGEIGSLKEKGCVRELRSGVTQKRNIFQKLFYPIKNKFHVLKSFGYGIWVISN